MLAANTGGVGHDGTVASLGAEGGGQAAACGGAAAGVAKVGAAAGGARAAAAVGGGGRRFGGLRGESGGRPRLGQRWARPK
jgi:hypothetical protein